MGCRYRGGHASGYIGCGALAGFGMVWPRRWLQRLERLMNSLDPTPTVEVTHRTLKNEQGRVFREIDAAGVMAVRNRGQIDGILMAPSMFDALRSRAAAAERLLAALPLLI